ncbi:uncharacterized protein TNCV_2041791 [Trichonephila clavipes]|nr:uncharacterized protein TNCV_2041791 [Trichonephila clavipes]
MASAVLADPTRALQGTNRATGTAMEESVNDVESLEQLLLYADEHYLAGKLPLGDHLGKILHGVEEYHQRNVGPLRFHASQLKWTGYYRLWPPRPLHQMCGQRSCRYSDVKGSARKGRSDLRFASARCLEIACGTIATPTSARIVKRVTSHCGVHKYLSQYPSILSPRGLPVAPDPVLRTWVPARVHCSQQFLMAHSERSTWPATRRVDQPAVFIPMIRPLSNSLNCEKCLLARSPGMFRLPKSFYNRRLIVTFMNLRICAGLYNTLFLIVAPPRRV